MKLNEERLVSLRKEAESWPAYMKAELGSSAPDRVRTAEQYIAILGPMLTRCRAAQDAEHGGPDHDDTHTPHDWAEFIRKFAGRAEYQGQFADNAGAVARYQQYMIAVAGLAISAVLSSQRKVRGESARNTPPLRDVNLF